MTRHVPNAIALSGVSLLAYGLHLVHPSLAFIAAGAFVAYLGVRLHLSQKPKDKPQ